MDTVKLLAGTGLFSFLLIASPLAGPQGPPPAPTSNMPAINANVSSQEFVSKAAVSDKYEISAAKIAEERTHNPAIDRFAARMIQDHSQSTAKLERVVANSGRLHLPAELDAQHRGLIKELRRLGKRQFEVTFAQQQVQAHEDAVALFTAYRNNGDNPRLKRFASKILPIIRHHLDMARSLPGGPQIVGNR